VGDAAAKVGAAVAAAETAASWLAPVLWGAAPASPKGGGRGGRALVSGDATRSGATAGDSSAGAPTLPVDPNGSSCVLVAAAAVATSGARGGEAAAGAAGAAEAAGAGTASGAASAR
jgi:hypothetical protein